MSIFRFLSDRSAGPSQIEAQQSGEQGVPAGNGGFAGLRATMADAMRNIRAGREAHARETQQQQATQSMHMLTERPNFHPGHRLDAGPAALGGQGSTTPRTDGPRSIPAYMGGQTGGTRGFKQPAQVGRTVPTVPPTRLPRPLE